MTPRRRRLIGPALLAVIGIGVMLTGMAFHFWRPDAYKLEWSVQFIGAAIAFAGFYAMDPKGAKDGGGFLVDAGTRIVGVIRTGQRASDPVVMVTKQDDPAPSPAVELPVDDHGPIPPLAKIPGSEKGL